MAVKYLSGNRIQGASNAELSGKIAGTAGSGSQYFDWTRTAGTVLNSRMNLSYDLGATLNDTQWIMRFKLYINAFTVNNGSGCHFSVGMSDADADTAHDSSQDSISFAIQFASSANEQNFRGRDSAASEMSQHNNEIGTNMLTGSAGKTYYVQIKRTGTTAGTVSVTENSDYTTSTTSVSLSTLSASTGGLRYFVSKGYDGQNNAVDNHVYGSITDVKIYDNQSSPTTVTYDVNEFMKSTSGWNINDTATQNIIPIETDEKVAITNIPIGTRYEETDTNKIFSRVGGTNIVGWVEKGTAPTADILRGCWAGGGTYEDVIDYITFASVGNATDFGNLTVARQGAAGGSGTGRGLFGGGTTGSYVNTIDYITIASTGDATDFGNLTAVRGANAEAVSSDTRGCWGGGNSGSYTNIIDYVTIASVGNATDFGDLFMARGHLCSASSPVGATRGLFAGGSGTGSSVNTIEYITIASTGNATDFGDLLSARSSSGGLADATRGCFAGGGGYVTDIDYVTIASTGNAADFGNLSVGRQNLEGSAGHTRGCFAGGSGNSGGDVIDYITVATLGNATDFGNLTVSRSYVAGQVSG